MFRSKPFSIISPVYGQNFSSDESAVFLSIVDAIKAEAKLAQENLLNNNVSLASAHANKASALLTANVNDEIVETNQRLADELNTALTTLKTSITSVQGNESVNDMNFVFGDIDAILDEVVTARISPEQLNNSTTQVLRIIEILDKVLSNYGDSFAVGFDMTNMSNLIIDEGVNRSLINVTDYQTSKALAERAQELFNSEQMNASIAASEITDQSVDNIASVLEELVTDIGNRTPPKEIMTIVHTKLHPSFLASFNLNPAIH
ncbi:MAG TPA: hypothetical protein VE130_06380 [Nitrososphaeraceae archaeon]|jgi:hypothetical protein|nr:hypothetical protein [Nitrososphaeraceae archaeon]